MPVMIGTCSWTDRMLIETGRFYPTSRPSAEEMLRYYYSVFPTVEVDSSFYSLPSKRNSELWVHRTPNDFTFHIKAYSLFTTHGTPPQRLPKDIVESLPASTQGKRNLYSRDMPDETLEELWRRFREALVPLREAGKLGFVLLQFPRWFVPRRDCFDYLLTCKEALWDFDVAVEFRQKDWLREDRRDRTLAFLRDNELALVGVDEPQGFNSSVLPVAEATAERAYIRFHGRNQETWEKRGITTNERFNYWYTAEDFKEWEPRIRRLEEDSQAVYLMMNTNFGDPGLVNARPLAEVLGVRLGQQPQLL